MGLKLSKKQKQEMIDKLLDIKHIATQLEDGLMDMAEEQGLPEDEIDDADSLFSNVVSISESAQDAIAAINSLA